MHKVRAVPPYKSAWETVQISMSGISSFRSSLSDPLWGASVSPLCQHLWWGSHWSLYLSFLAMQLNIHDKNVQDYGAGGILVEKHLMQDSFASHSASDWCCWEQNKKTKKSTAIVPLKFCTLLLISPLTDVAESKTKKTKKKIKEKKQ